MLNISLQTKGNLTEKLQKLITGLSANQSVLMGKISKEIAVRLQKKFLSNGGESFWKDASNSIYKHHTETTANVVVKKVGVALQRYGGTVLPKRAKRLAIPLQRQFKGFNPREITGRKLFTLGARRALGRGFLAYKEGDAIRVAYLLTPKAVIKPHPEKFLSDNEIISASEEIIHIYTNKLYGLSI